MKLSVLSQAPHVPNFLVSALTGTPRVQLLVLSQAPHVPNFLVSALADTQRVQLLVLSQAPRRHTQTLDALTGIVFGCSNSRCSHRHLNIKFIQRGFGRIDCHTSYV